MKYKDPLDLLTDLGIVLECSTGQFKGRHIRYLENHGVVQIGELDFDRWANSLEMEFDLLLPREQRKFIRWAESYENETENS